MEDFAANPRFVVTSLDAENNTVEPRLVTGRTVITPTETYN